MQAMAIPSDLCKYLSVLTQVRQCLTLVDTIEPAKETPNALPKGVIAPFAGTCHPTWEPSVYGATLATADPLANEGCNYGNQHHTAR